MLISRRAFILSISGFGGFIFLQFLSEKSKRLYIASVAIQKLQLSDDEWKQRLSQDAYLGLRKGSTEMRRSSQLNHEWRQQIYYCRGCDSALFTSAMKYQSHSG